MTEIMHAPDTTSIRLTPAGKMGQSIKAWLNSENSLDWQLVDWLRGYDLPLSSGNDEPHLWLMRGLEEIGMARQENSPFCKRLAGVIKQLPKIAQDGKRPEQVIYNALMLAACLHCPKCLGESLLAVNSRDEIQGEWTRIDLRVALRLALIENQINQDLWPVWESLVEEAPNRPLPGTPLDGFTGICKMPRSADKLGEPDVEAILWGLTRMVAILTETPDRVKNLFHLFHGLKKKYPKINWALKAVEGSPINRWASWSIGVAAHLLVEADSARPNERLIHAEQIREALRGVAPVSNHRKSA